MDENETDCLFFIYGKAYDIHYSPAPGSYHHAGPTERDPYDYPWRRLGGHFTDIYPSSKEDEDAVNITRDRIKAVFDHKWDLDSDKGPRPRTRMTEDYNDKRYKYVGRYLWSVKNPRRRYFRPPRPKRYAENSERQNKRQKLSEEGRWKVEEDFEKYGNCDQDCAKLIDGLKELKVGA